jgi:hypothetical protein
MLPVAFANARKTTPYAAFSQFFCLQARLPSKPRVFHVPVNTQPVCALGNRLINPQQIVPM